MELELEFLVTDLANIIALSGLQLEQHTNNYIKKRLGLCLTDFSQEQDNNRQTNGNIQKYKQALNMDLGKRSAFYQFYQQNQERFQRICPDNDQAEKLRQVQAQFNKLSQSQKISCLQRYMKTPLVDLANIQIHCFDNERGANDQGHNLVNYGDVTNGGLGLLLQSGNFIIGGTNNKILGYESVSKNGVHDHSKRNGIDSYRNSLSQSNGFGIDNRNKQDIYKMALAQKGHEKSERNIRNEEQREKSQFQTLKSLFKKLQNTA